MKPTNDCAERPLQPEIELLVICAVKTLSGARANRLIEAAATITNWEGVLARAVRHGLIPLLFQHLNDHASHLAPPAILEKLHDMKTQNAWHTLRLNDELQLLLQALSRQGIAVIPYKGPLLAREFYGDVTHRQFNDLDIFIKQQDVPRAIRVLQECGYQTETNPTARQLAKVLSYNCELPLTNYEREVHLDLHWDFVPRYFTVRLKLDGLWERARRVSWEGSSGLSLAPEDALLTLALNAGKDFWSRLLSLCDVAELVHQTPGLNWPELWHRAVEARAQRMLGLSLWLARELLGATLPQFVAEKLSHDPALPKLAEQVKALLEADGFQPMQFRSFLLPARALPGPLARLRFYLRLSLQPTFEDWNYIQLPERLDFLYYLTRPIRLTQKYLLRRKKS
jgi:hypothetical protein